jgi:NADPH-dependent ferric siderophore reductase
VTRGSEGGDATRLRDALTAFGPLPPGDGYVWIAGEAHIARTLRAHVTGVLGHPKAWVKAAGYWMTGHANTHETIQD